jgi:hypothetical protein
MNLWTRSKDLFSPHEHFHFLGSERGYIILWGMYETITMTDC